MKQILKNIKLYSVICSVLACVLGVCLITVPALNKLTIIYLISSLVLVIGVVNIVETFLYGYESMSFIRGVFDILIAVALLFCAPFLEASRIFSFVVGMIFAIKGIFDIQNSIDYYKKGVSLWWVSLVFAIFTIVFGAICLANPASEFRLLTFIGTVLVVEAILTIVLAINNSTELTAQKTSLKKYFQKQTTTQQKNETPAVKNKENISN